MEKEMFPGALPVQPEEAKQESVSPEAEPEIHFNFPDGTIGTAKSKMDAAEKIAEWRESQ